MNSIFDLGLINLTIPAWQMAIYIIVFTLFMFAHETRGCLLTTYVFGLYWCYYLYGREFIAAAGVNTAMFTAYIGFGFMLACFSLISLFYEK